MPTTPDDFKALIPAANTSICSKIIQLFITLPTRLYQLVSEMKNADGTWSDSFKAALGLTVGGLAAPTNVAASDGGSQTSITITWSPVTAAQSYQLFRNTTNNSATAVQIGSPSLTSYTDTDGLTQGQTYWYWVKAVNSGGVSAFSAGDSGYSGGTQSGQVLDFNSTQDWTVPTGVTTIRIKIWGAGGGGGGPYSPSAQAPAYGGGGGGSGEFRDFSLIAVSPTQVIHFEIGDGGAAGAVMSSGAQGGATFATRSGSQLGIAFGGLGGGPGNGTPPGIGGTGGTGGSGGSNSVGTPVSNQNGNVGNNGIVATGGTGGTAVNGYGAGGNAAYIGLEGSKKGSIGHAQVTLNA